MGSQRTSTVRVSLDSTGGGRIAASRGSGESAAIWLVKHAIASRLARRAACGACTRWAPSNASSGSCGWAQCQSHTAYPHRSAPVSLAAGLAPVAVASWLGVTVAGNRCQTHVSGFEHHPECGPDGARFDGAVGQSEAVHGPGGEDGAGAEHLVVGVRNHHHEPAGRPAGHGVETGKPVEDSRGLPAGFGGARSVQRPNHRIVSSSRASSPSAARSASAWLCRT